VARMLAQAAGRGVEVRLCPEFTKIRHRRHRPALRAERGGPHRHRDDRRRTRLGATSRPVHTMARPRHGRTRHPPDRLKAQDT
jgi:hypothetical protein